MLTVFRIGKKIGVRISWKPDFHFLTGMFCAAGIFLACAFGAHSLKAAVVLGCAALVLSVAQLRLPTPLPDAVALALGAVSSLALSQLVMNEGLGLLEPGFLWLGLACCLVVELLLLALTGRIVPAVAGTVLTALVLTTVNYYVFEFRGVEFQPMDILYAQIALSVAGNYHYTVEPCQIYAWSMGILTVQLTAALVGKEDAAWARRAAGRCLCGFAGVLLIGVLWFAADRVTLRGWQKNGTIYHGYLASFALRCFETGTSAPEGYSMEQIRRLEEEYAVEDAGAGDVNIIVIMNESFADFGIYGEAFADHTPFFSSLQENTIRGWALTSIYGGKTANAEFEFLTGHTMAFLPNSAVPYQSHIRSETASMVSDLQERGYDCIAMHPYGAEGWMRSTVYPRLGFSQCYFLESFPREQLLRSYVSDREFYEQVILQFEEPRQQPLFLWGVTMQNHGGYDYQGPNFTKSVELEGFGPEADWAEQYLTVLEASDRALEYLVGYFAEAEEPVLLVFFGDHQPTMDMALLERLYGDTIDTLDEQQLLYTVPFFLWANYDLTQEELPLTSLNYLSSLVYEAAGMEMTPYHAFLSDLQQVIPAINANGYYSKEKGCFLPLEQAEGEEALWLARYEQLQYNAVHDREHTSQVFFPAPQEKG